MNVRGGWALIKGTWLSWLQHRSFFFLLAFGWMMPPLISLFIWYTAASGRTVGGLTQGEFVAYYLAVILVNQLTYSQTNWTASDRIRDGSMSFLLLRPISPHFSTLAAEIAGKIVYMAFVIPVATVLGFILHPELHMTVRNGLLFLLSLTLAWLLRFLWGYWLATLAFWTTRADALLMLQDALVFLLAGQVAPVALLPGSLQTVAKMLPFRYMVGFPIEILLGHLNNNELLMGLAYQAGWLLFVSILFAVIWHRGLKRYTAVGG